MNITIIALGSRGDVQPFVALGKGLEAEGHAVRIAAAEDYASVVRDHGLAFAPLVGRIADRMDRRLVLDALDASANPIALGRRFLRQVEPFVAPLVADCRRAAEDADRIVASTLGMPVAEPVAEALGVSLIPAHFHPNTPTVSTPHVFFPPIRFASGLYNRLTYALAAHGMGQFLRPTINRARRSVLGLPPLGPAALAARIRRESATPTLYGYSPRLLPPPPDWDSKKQIVTGFWFLDRPENWRPPDDLDAFLDSGPPPVCVSIGSVLVGRDPDTVTRWFVDALGRLGQRGVLLSGWGDLGNIALPPAVFRPTGPIWHDWLFPRCRAIVHHGGAGTTAAGLRAGVPAVIVPFYGDQTLWANRVAALGAGPPPIPRPMLSVDRLTDTLARVLDDATMRSAAAGLGRKIAAENGVENAVKTIGLSTQAT